MNTIYKIRNDEISSILCEKDACCRKSYVLGFIIFFIIAFAPVADAGCSCGAGNWDPYAFLNSEPGISSSIQSTSTQNNSAGNSGSSTQNTFNRAESFPNSQILKPMKSVSSSDVIVDVSNGDSYAKSHIKNAIHIPTKDFLNNEGNLKTSEELASILGNAGISRDNSVIVYGPAESSGEAEFAYSMLRYLGQNDVKLLDGSLADWKAAGLPEETSEIRKSGVEYKPEVNPEVMASYDYIKSGQVQLLDVRPFGDFSKGRIPGSFAFDASNVIRGNKIKNGNDLSIVFSRLDKDKPIVVYSSDYARSSLVWYALQLMGYQASIYSWEDWKAHESSGSKSSTAATGESTSRSKYMKLGTT